MSRSPGAAEERGFIARLIERVRAARERGRWTAFDQRMLEFYARFIAPGELCFDVGANMGNRVKVFLRLGARVLAVEPQAACIHHLKALYGEDPRFQLIPQALGAAEGQMELLISEVHTISSLSPAWIEAVRKSGRFAEFSWNARQTVPVTTLDRLIAAHGTPSFIKIDVEGFESEVLRGLSQPIRTLSFEFVPEFIDSALRCINHLDSLGETRWNYSMAETMSLALDAWVGPERMAAILAGYRNDPTVFGDVYAQSGGVLGPGRPAR
jgi:FkbM family methyltransferase